MRNWLADWKNNNKKTVLQDNMISLENSKYSNNKSNNSLLDNMNKRICDY